MDGDHTMRACVVVLGDWGRSPRMQYHALSLARNGYTVDVLAYEGAKPHEAVRNNRFICHHYLKEVPKFPYVRGFLYYVLKTLWQTYTLLATFLCMSKPNIMLVQNPPSIPALPVCWFVCWLWKINFVIDFHNYGYTLLALTLGKTSRLVNMCKWCEEYFGQKAVHSFCVSQAMKEDLAKNWDIYSTVFYDCPPEIFHPISIEEKHKFFLKLGEQYSPFQASIENMGSGEESTRFTIKTNKNVMPLNRRPVLIISSTSWTEDEDFSILLLALTKYEEAVNLNQNLPKIVMVITGKGPMKQMYEDLIEKKDFNHVEIITLWLAAENYPIMLACADVGISLHRSTSGLDLPMKVVDMFGCHLPVCAYYYPCIQELVKEKENGLWFMDGQQLFHRLQNLLRHFPHGANDLLSYRYHLSMYPLPRWNESWEEHVLPVIRLVS